VSLVRSFIFEDEEVDEAGWIVLLLPRHVHPCARLAGLDIGHKFHWLVTQIAACELTALLMILLRSGLFAPQTAPKYTQTVV
jgi:hypothetical protein